jgi:hypothetical protein
MSVGNTGMTESGGVHFEPDINSAASSSSSLTTRAPTTEEMKTDTVFRDVSLNLPGSDQSPQVHKPRKEIPPQTETPIPLDPGKLVAQVKVEAASKGPQPAKETKVSIHTKWAGPFQKPLSETDQPSLQEMIRTRRQEIKGSKEDYRAKQQEAMQLSSLIDEGKKEILQIGATLRSFEEKGTQGQESQSLKEQLQKVKERIETHQKALTPLQSFLPNQETTEKVETHLSSGTLTSVEGGKSGVYFLRDSQGKPRYVIKPLDEEMLALNNPKAYATPYCDADGECRPKGGIPMYQSVINEELASKVASLLGISSSTARSDVMIIKSDSFADITDGIEEDRAIFGNADKEKLCFVQEFLSGCREMGDILLSGGNITKDTFMEMEGDERDAYEKQHSPDNIDQAMYEKGCILEWVCGETDGNAGNFMVADQPHEQTGLRDIYKIDAAASFTEDNSTLRPGGCWIMHNHDNPLSDEAMKILEDVDTVKIAELMRSRGKSEKAVEAMKDRVEYIQHLVKEYSSEGLSASEIDYFLDEQYSVEESMGSEEQPEISEENPSEDSFRKE